MTHNPQSIIKTLSELLEKATGALEPFARAADTMHDVGGGAFPVDGTALIFSAYDEADRLVELTVDDFRRAKAAYDTLLQQEQAAPGDEWETEEYPSAFSISKRRFDERTKPADEQLPAADDVRGIIPLEPKATTMTKDQIEHMVQRFLAWRLPENFNPDNGISVERPSYATNIVWHPMGTNLLDYTQATAMVRHMIEGLSADERGDGQ